MSCFVVNDYHVNALVAWAVRQGLPLGAVSPDALAHELASANRAAFHQRYAGDYPDESPAFEGFDLVDASHLVPVAVVKACDCLEYQASDWSSWRESDACAHLAAIRAAALAMAMAGHGIAAGPNAGGLDYGRELPGYDAAAWELSESETLGDPDQAGPVDQVADRLAAALGDMAEPEFSAIRSALVAVAADRRAAELARGAA